MAWRKQIVSIDVNVTFIISMSSASLSISYCVISILVGCFGVNSPLRQYFSLYRAVSQREGAVSQREGDRGEKG